MRFLLNFVTRIVNETRGRDSLSDSIGVVYRARNGVGEMSDKGNISLIGDGAITVESVLGIALSESKDIDGVVVIMFKKDKTSSISCACSISELAYAQMLIAEHFLTVRNGSFPTHFDGSHN